MKVESAYCIFLYFFSINNYHNKAPIKVSSDEAIETANLIALKRVCCCNIPYGDALRCNQSRKEAKK
ncbi:hypothetical protein Scep_029620 [Stephania cephalantha]|uniref:Uncharacterized protein n=1 Tax=Stephania cephalantha TaxID=152367 RepID=A0AAP0DY09_9MAGN